MDKLIFTPQMLFLSKTEVKYIEYILFIERIIDLED